MKTIHSIWHRGEDLMTLYLHTEYVGAHSYTITASSFVFYRFEYSQVYADIVQNTDT
jgi:hypothetical protein